MDFNVSIEEIQEQFDSCTMNATDDSLNKMKELCFVYRCNAEDIVCHWIAFYMSRKLDSTPTVKMLELMEKEELMKKKSTKKEKSKKSVTAPIFNASTIENIDDSFELVDRGNKTNFAVNSPGIFSPNSISPASFTPSVRYSSRKGAGAVVCSFGKLEDVEWKQSDEFSVSVSSFSDTTVIKDSYYFMCEKLRDLASILNDMIQDAAQGFKDKYEIEDWGQIQLPSVETVPVLGRICADHTGRLNAASIFLEGSQEISSGQNICIDVSRLNEFSFFPGQIIAGLGINTTGKKLILEKLYQGIYPPYCQKIPDLPNCIDSLSVVVAAGPFTTSDTLSNEPFQDLMKYVKINNPHVLILLGPFVDMKNQKIQNDELTETFDEIFQDLISKVISHIDNLNTKVIIVPSTKDAHHFPVYPTPPYKAKHATKRLYFASDPCILNIEGILFGLTSTDILFHLGKEEISYPQLPDRLGRLCRHILLQKNFYPLYPPNEEMNIDYLHFEHSAGIPVMPHILILPSDLRHFIKDIDGCCCINPERLTKRVTGGTFSRIKVKRPEKSNLKSIMDFIQVEILKI